MEMTVLLIRANRNDVDEHALEAEGIECFTDPYLSITEEPNHAGAQRMKNALLSSDPTWLIVTSSNALPFFEQLLEVNELESIIRSNKALKFAAIGSQTRKALEDRGASHVLTPNEAYAESLASLMVKTEPCEVVIPSGSIAMQTLDNALTAAGFTVIAEIVYNTELVERAPRSVEMIASGELGGVLLRSPSAARAFVSFNGTPDISVFCAGKTTARQAESLGLTITATSDDPAPEAVARTISTYLKEHP